MRPRTRTPTTPRKRRQRSVLQKRLHETNALLAAIVEGTDDAVIGKDLDGTITSWNKGAERMYGYLADEAIGRPIAMLAPLALAGEPADILQKIRRGERIEHFETVRLRKDGRQLNVSLTISPIRDALGKIVGSSTIGRDITRQVADSDLLRRQAVILNQIRDSVVTTDLDGRITGWNQGARRMFSYSESEALGKHISLIYPEHQLAFLEREVIGPLKEKGEHECEVRLRRKSGEEFYALLLLTLLRNGNGAVTGMIGSSVDITTLKRAEEQARIAREEWEQTFDAIPDIVVVIDNQHIIRRANKALAARTGINRDNLIGTPCYESLCGLEEPLPSCPGSRSIATGKEQIEERRIEKLNGHYLISCTPIVAPDGSVTWSVEVCRDISEQKNLEHRLQKAATTDELTGLLNRRGFLAAAEHQVRIAHREKKYLALLYLDLNNMKAINDRFSHAEGDRALADTAALLRSSLRESDIIARLGGDEFAAMLVEHAKTDVESTVVRNILRNVAGHNALGSRPYQLSLSIGVASYDPGRPSTLDELMSSADSLMYRQKQQIKLDREIEASLEEGVKKRRLYDRLVVDARWWAEVEEIGRCEIQNISARGVCLKAGRDIAVGSRHRITIHSPHRDISQEAVGIWCSPAEPGPQGGAPYYTAGMSILGPEELHALPSSG